jgi:hypothetical protein
VGLISLEEFRGDKRVPEAWRGDEALMEALDDPVRFLLVLGGNRASKTEWGCKRVVQCAVRFAGARVWVFHEDNTQSVDYHQSLVWKYLPVSWKNAGKGRVAYVSYTQKNGFSDNKLVGPNGSEIEFRNYLQDDKSVEGGEVGDPRKGRCIGWYGDELMPLPWLETLGYRLVTRRAIGLLGFTPIEGHSEVVSACTDHAKTVRWEEAPEVVDGFGRPKRVPLVQVADQKVGDSVRKTVTVYFHSKWNPYSDYQDLLAETAGAGDETRLVRLYGFTTKRRLSRFPRLLREVHGFKPQVEAARGREALPAGVWGTGYQVVDPAGKKNWFMLWARVDAWERVWVYREWPCPALWVPGVGRPEPWAVSGSSSQHKFGGLPGGGQKQMGLSLQEYKGEIARWEGWADSKLDAEPAEWDEENGSEDEVYLRLMDSRFADAPSYTSAGNTTLIEECAESGLFFELASGKNIDEGVDLINDALAYKRPDWEAPGDGPSLFISEDCVNLWFALENWTGEGGNREATKDPVDCLRYLFLQRPAFLEGESGGSRGEGAGYGQRVSAGGGVESGKRERVFAKLRGRGI